MPINVNYTVEELKEGTYTNKFAASVTTGTAMTAATTPALDDTNAVAGVYGTLGSTTVAAFRNVRNKYDLTITKNLNNPIATDAGDTFYFESRHRQQGAVV